MILTDEQLKKVKNVEIEILKSFIEVCEKLGLKYYAIAGTALGIVRHKGFIPWDDDIDVAMMREDYEYFLEHAQQYLPEHLFLQTYKNDKGYHQGFAKIRNSNTTFIETAVKDNEMNHGIYIDIFPIDYCDVKKVKTPWFKFKERIYCIGVAGLFSNIKLSFKAKLFYAFSKLFCFSGKQAIAKRDELYKSMPKGGMVASIYAYGVKELVPIEWYGEGKKMEFEGIEVVVPNECDKYLKQIFGDYMQLPPVEKRVTHHLTDVIDVEKSYLEYMRK